MSNQLIREDLDDGSVLFRSPLSKSVTYSAVVACLLLSLGVLIAWWTGFQPENNRQGDASWFWVTSIVSGAGVLIGLISQDQLPAEERLIIAPKFGVQVEILLPQGKRTAKTFLPIKALESVFINEVISWCTVKFKLCIVADGHEKMILVFDQSEPRLADLRLVYKELNSLIPSE